MKAVVDQIVEQWDSARLPDVEVVDTYNDLPGHVQEVITGRFSPESPVRAAIHNGDDKTTVYIIADQVTNANEARRVLAHEVVGHHSVREMLGAEFYTVMFDLHNARDQARIKPYADQVDRDYPHANDTVKAEEVLAAMAEDGVKHPILSRVIAGVRRFLRDLGMKLPYSYDEVMSLLSAAERRLRVKKRAAREAAYEQPNPVLHKERTERRQREALEPLRLAVQQAERESRVGTQPRRPPLIELTRPVESFFRTVFTVPLGGRDQDGNLKLSQSAIDATGKVLEELRPDPDGLFRWLDRPIEVSRHGWLNRYKTPKEFIARERRKFADSYAIMGELVEFLRAIADQEIGFEESKALQEVLEGKNLNDARMNRLAEPIRKRIMEYGQELVDLGLLEKEAYLSNLGTYMHRSYRKYEFDAPTLVKWNRRRQTRSRAALRGDEFVSRGRRHKVKADRLMRDVPKQIKADALQAEQWDVHELVTDDGQVGRRLYWPSNIAISEAPADVSSPGWVNQGTWDLRRTKAKGKAKGGQTYLARDWTEAEREEMGEIRDARYNLIQTYELFAHDLAGGRFYQGRRRQPGVVFPGGPGRERGRCDRDRLRLFKHRGH